MDQQLFESYSKIFSPTETENTIRNADAILSDRASDDISFFFSLKTSTDPTVNSKVANNNHSISTSETIIIKRIQNQLAQLTKCVALDEIDTQVSNLLIRDVFPNVEITYKNASKKISDRVEKQQQLQTSLADKQQKEKFTEMSIFLQSKTHNDDQQLSYFAVQSLSSILLILIKSVQKNDPSIVQNILTLTSQLCEQLPMKYLTSPNQNKFLSKSLKSLINYIQELLLSKDSIQAQQARIILLSFSIAKGSFKDILPLLTDMIFDSVNSYPVRGVLIQLNNGLEKTIEQETSGRKLNLR